jgi:hypothetical protein
MRRLLPAFLLIAAASVTGCQSNPNDVSFNTVKGNLTPELQTLDESNQDFRMFWSDLGRAFYTDRPSYLSPMPVVATGG